ncbi:hypothetical protein [Rosistilla carotiformis]|uniref:hypothetical protein n=1 Tax=Rosistilla carotiformis TaxID=2528017 RepID=UPI0018D223C9|nr:hypothetical protein [Rosistilla carotiformis]
MTAKAIVAGGTDTRDARRRIPIHAAAKRGKDSPHINDRNDDPSRIQGQIDMAAEESI